MKKGEPVIFVLCAVMMAMVSFEAKAGALTIYTDTTDVERIDSRPLRVRRLLSRLEEAERTGNVEMAIVAIEALRSLPGSPAADLEGRLVSRLGDLNLAFLFEKKSPRWVRLVTVKSGDTASRIALEFGSTLDSINRLNDNALDNMESVHSVYVLDHPRFVLTVHRRTKTADLYLNGKFFKRYDLKSVTGLKEGSYAWSEISLSVINRQELEMLLPQNTTVLVSEL